MPEPTVYLWRENAEHQRWKPTTLAAEGKDEKFLERLIAERPELLGLESRSTGIYGPFVPFSQLAFVTPQGRNIRPDLVFLTASGHAVIVEVKRYNNPELRERHVIAQVVDYAASFAALKPEELLRLFQSSPDAVASWPALAELLFPDEEDPQELAKTLLRRFRNGEIHLVIACDREPPGLRELVEGVASQSALSFGFSVVELRPYVSDDNNNGILFFQNTAVETEIVTRTAVTFHIRHGDTEPKVEILVDSPKKVEQAVEKARRVRARREETIMYGAVSFLDENLNDLIEEGRLTLFDRQDGCVVKSQMTLDSVGTCQLNVSLEDTEDGVDDGQVSIRWWMIGRQDRRSRVAELQGLVAGEKDPLEKLLGTKLEPFVDNNNGSGWTLSSSIFPQPWTPEIVAEKVAGIYRHFVDLLQPQAVRRVRKEESDV
ncbi:MAG: hypothetical protein M0R80_22360 [Proteobacteria bacterium]|jgi:hypothetical protein|nr:hypothetical protein [Pseudomonadota bacterium]